MDDLKNQYFVVTCHDGPPIAIAFPKMTSSYKACFINFELSASLQQEYKRELQYTDEVIDSFEEVLLRDILQNQHQKAFNLVADYLLRVVFGTPDHHYSVSEDRGYNAVS